MVALGGVWHGQGGERGAVAGLALGLAGAFGAIVHGAADLAVALHPLALDPAAPNAVDPRGVLTFGAAGLGLLVLGRVAARTRRLPRGVTLLAAVTGTLLVVLYLARLVVLDPASPLVLVPALLAGFGAAPLLWLAIGSVLVRAPSRAGAT